MLTPITNSQSSSGTSISRVPCIGTPALLQATWSFPKARSTCARASTTDCSSVTSTRTAMTRLFVPREGVSRLLDRNFLDVSHDHVGARLGERLSNVEADAGSGTGDDCGLARDVLHPRGSLLASNIARETVSQPRRGRCAYRCRRRSCPPPRW